MKYFRVIFIIEFKVGLLIAFQTNFRSPVSFKYKKLNYTKDWLNAMETIKDVMKKDAHIKHETGFIRGFSCSGRIFKIMICVSE